MPSPPPRLFDNAQLLTGAPGPAKATAAADSALLRNFIIVMHQFENYISSVSFGIGEGA